MNDSLLVPKTDILPPAQKNLSESNRSILVKAVNKIQGEDLEERPGPVSRVLSGK
jgi:hypothetical protein